MAILFDWYENPQSSEQQGEKRIAVVIRRSWLKWGSDEHGLKPVPVFRNVVR